VGTAAYLKTKTVGRCPTPRQGAALDPQGDSPLPPAGGQVTPQNFLCFLRVKLVMCLVKFAVDFS